MMNIKGVAFDLDGTLVNSIEDLASSMNRVLLELGFPVHSVDDYKKFVGNGIRNLVFAALPEELRDDKTVNACYTLMIKDYREHCLDRSVLYEGIDELLKELSERQIKMAVLTNKVDELAHKVVGHLMPERNFQLILGVSDKVPRKPDPTGALMIGGQLGIPSGDFLYVGDSGVDMETAERAGIYGVGALWGFRSREELVRAGAKDLIERPLDLLQVLEKKSGEVSNE